MQNNNGDFFKTVFIEYVKKHDECKGEVLEILNHIDEASKIAQSLPLNVQEELKQLICNGLMANGIASIFFK